MSEHRYYNTTDSPVLMDDEGHILGGREHAVFESNRHIANAIELGLLIDQGEVEEEQEEPEEETPEPTPDSVEDGKPSRAVQKKSSSSNRNK